MTPWTLMLLAMTAAPPPGGQLLFGPADLPALRERAAQPEFQVWITAQRGEARALADPASPRYANPAELGKSTTTDPRPQIKAHEYGRRLTEWVETLGLVYQLDGLTAAGGHGARLLAAAARDLPVARADIAGSFAGARGDVLRGFATGYDLVGDCLTDAERPQVEAAMAAYIENLLAESEKPGTWWVPHHNYMGVCLGACGLAALDLTGRDARVEGWLERIDRGLLRWFEGGFDSDGAYVEGTDYGCYGLDNCVTYALARRRRGGPNLLDHPRLRRVSHFYAQEMLPGELVFEARNDANYGRINTPAMLGLANAIDDPLARWLGTAAAPRGNWRRLVWDVGGKTLDPAAAGEPLDALFAGRGLAVHRTGWTAADAMLAVEAGPYYPVTHNQSDKGHFTFYALGERWAIDSGYGNNHDPDGRTSSQAHNLVLIDGRGQTGSGAGWGNDGKVIAFQPGARVSMTTTDAAPAWRTNNAKAQGLAVERALRHVALARPSHGAPAYAAVFDDLRLDAAEHDFDWLLHTPTGHGVEVLPDGCRLRPVDAGADHLITPLGATGGGVARWTVQAPAGRYALHGLVRATGPELAKADSFVVAVAGKTVQWHAPTSADWVWARVGDGVPPREVWFDLPGGAVTIELRTREPGAACARLALTPQAEWRLTDAATAVLTAQAAAVTAPMVLVKDTAPPRPTCRVWVFAAAPATGRVDAFDGHPRYRSACRAVEPRFIALLVPLTGDQPEPSVSRAADGSLTVTWPGRTDRWTWPAGAPPSLTMTP